MSKVGKRILAGLNDAIAFARGDKTRGRLLTRKEIRADVLKRHEEIGAQVAREIMKRRRRPSAIFYHQV